MEISYVNKKEFTSRRAATAATARVGHISPTTIEYRDFSVGPKISGVKNTFLG